MSARSENRGRLAGKDLYGAPVATLAKRYGVTRTAIYKAREAARVGPAKTLSTADLTRPTADLCAEYNVTPSAVYMQRRRAGVVVPKPPRPGKLRDADLTRQTADLCAEYGVCDSAVHQARKRRGVPTPHPLASVGIRPRVNVPPPVVAKPAPTFEDVDLVAAVDDELALCPSPYVAALIVSRRLRVPMARVLAVAESRRGVVDDVARAAK